MKITILNASGSVENIIESPSLEYAQQVYPTAREWVSTDVMPDQQYIQSPQIYSIQAAWLMIVLQEMGLLASVQAYVSAASAVNPAIALLFNPGVTFQNNNALIGAWAASVGKTQTDVDALFIAAIAAASS